MYSNRLQKRFTWQDAPFRQRFVIAATSLQKVYAQLYYPWVNIKLEESEEYNFTYKAGKPATLLYKEKHVLKLSQYELISYLAQISLKIYSSHPKRGEGKDPENWAIASTLSMVPTLNWFGFILPEGFLSQPHERAALDILHQLMRDDGHDPGNASAEIFYKYLPKEDGEEQPNPLADAASNQIIPSPEESSMDNLQSDGMSAMAKAAEERDNPNNPLKGRMPGNMPGELEQFLEAQEKVHHIPLSHLIQVGHHQSTGGDKPGRQIKQPLFHELGLLQKKLVKPIWHVIVGLDVSGSMYGEGLQHCANQLKAVSQRENPPSTIHAIFWDAEVSQHDVYEEFDLSRLSKGLDNYRVIGGGGTEPKCCIDYIRKKNLHKVPGTILLIISDMEINSPLTKEDSLGIPTIWVATPDHGDYKPPFGEFYVLPNDE